MSDTHPKKVLSSMIDASLWEALERRFRGGVETKRVHIERSLVGYLSPDDFSTEDEYHRLSEKYGVNK